MHVKASRVTLTRQIQPTHCIATVTALRKRPKKVGGTCQCANQLAVVAEPLSLG